MGPPLPSPDQPAPRTVLPVIEAGVHCPDCGYDLRGSTSPRCSECGYDLALLRATASQIPWTHRRRLGAVRAHWRTACLVTFRNRRFCTEAARPVSYADAQRFRWTTVFVAWTALVVMQLAPWVAAGPLLMYFETAEWLLVPLNLALLLALAALTGLPSCFFHPRAAPLALQNRAVALSGYACAPLGWLPLALAPCAAAYGLQFVHYESPLTELQTVLLCIALALGLWWWNLVRIAARVLRRRATTLLVASAVPLLGAVLTVLLLSAVPALAFYLVALLATWR